MTLQYIQIIIEVIIVLLGFYIAFFKSYFKQKGKNLATQEDIGKITNTVESIKAEFIHQAERLKVELQLQNQLRFSIKSEERGSLINCYDSYFLWYNQILRINPTKFNIDNIGNIKEELFNIEQSQLDFRNALSKLELYIGDKTLINSFQELDHTTMNYFTDQVGIMVNFEKFLNVEKKNVEGRKELKDEPSKELPDKGKAIVLINENREMYTKLLNVEHIELQEKCFNHINEIIANKN